LYLVDLFADNDAVADVRNARKCTRNACINDHVVFLRAQCTRNASGCVDRADPRNKRFHARSRAEPIEFLRYRAN
jgi:hypothetical protein